MAPNLKRSEKQWKNNSERDRIQKNKRVFMSVVEIFVFTGVEISLNLSTRFTFYIST